MRSQFLSASKGNNPRAQESILRRHDLAMRERTKIIADDCDRWDFNVFHVQAIVRQRQNEGKSTRDILLHPDDVVIDREKVFVLRDRSMSMSCLKLKKARRFEMFWFIKITWTSACRL